MQAVDLTRHQPRVEQVTHQRQSRRDTLGVLRLLTWCVVFVSASIVLHAQELSLMNGTWISARFMEGLKRSKSLSWTMESIPPQSPLWIQIDTTHAKLNVRAGFGFGDTTVLSMFQADLGELGRRWALGKQGQPTWMITPDPRDGQYVSLHWLDSLGATPLVFGKLPSRRSDPDFLIDRMISAVLLAGHWRDTTGATYVINTDATVLWKGARRDLQLDVRPPSNDIYVVLVDARGNEERFLAVRSGATLQLTNEQGKQLLLTQTH